MKLYTFTIIDKDENEQRRSATYDEDAVEQLGGVENIMKVMKEVANMTDETVELSVTETGAW
jgi:hypothetical protein